ncbi:MAG TPA: MFS transporter [Bacteroidales bacterium]|nr:MFS transporter [Bacteroidales bacterium]
MYLRDKTWFRWSMLLLVSLLMASNYYFYDALTPIKHLLTEKLGFSSTDYGLVQGFYAFPNTFLLMAILGGIILDRIGIRITGTVFAIFMLIGAWLTLYGASNYYNNGGPGYALMSSFLTSVSPSVKMMALGMLFFGLGAETSIVVFNKIIVKWFKGREIALAFAVNLSIARFGTALAIKLGPRFKEIDWLMPIWFGVLLLSITFLTFLIYLFNDYRLDKQIKDANPKMDPTEEFKISDVTGILKIRSFIFITLLCITFYAAFFPFLKYAPDFFLNKYGVSERTSGDITFWLPMGTVLFTPIFGALVDKKGRAASLMILGSLILIGAHLTFAFTHTNPYFLCALLGIAFSLVPAAMWPSVARIVEEKKLGTAYGIMFSTQNLGLFAIPILAGYVLDVTNKGNTGPLNYTYAMILFSSLGFIALFFAFMLKKDDKTSGYGLELPVKK